MRKMKAAHLSPADLVAKTAKWIVLIVFLFLTFVPLLWLLLSSFKTNLELLSKPFHLPAIWQWRNYVEAIRMSSLHRLFFNSALVSALSTALNILVCSMASFVFAREVFKFQNTLLNIILAGVLVPIIALMVPYFKVISTLNLYDSLLALILTYTAINIPVSVFLIKGFMATIPRELEEAGVMDGCNFWQRYYLIIFPLSRMGLVTSATFVFLFSWNEFIYALLLTTSIEARTLQLGIQFFRRQFYTDYTAMFAATVLTIIPSIIVYVTFHERIIKGLTSGAIKG